MQNRLIKKYAFFFKMQLKPLILYSYEKDKIIKFVLFENLNLTRTKDKGMHGLFFNF
jgi:hypothetical protein